MNSVGIWNYLRAVGKQCEQFDKEHARNGLKIGDFVLLLVRFFFSLADHWETIIQQLIFLKLLKIEKKLN